MWLWKSARHILNTNFFLKPHMHTAKSDLIKQHIDSFPVLPATVTRLMQVTSSPDSSVQDVVEVILSDQSLCLTVLKIANSSLFGRPKKADSLKMAVVILGFEEVQRIALTKALINSFHKLPQRHKRFINKFWQHSFVCGMAARLMAPGLTINPNNAFIGGLLHDIGKLIMLETFADDYEFDHWMAEFSTTEMLSREFRMFSFTHDALGGQLLKKWIFPENLVTAVSYHHRPDKAVQERRLAQVIQLADLLSFYCCNPESLLKNDILTTVHISLPEIQCQWQDCEMPLTEDAIAGWYDWLVMHQNQSDSLKESFSS
jgi:putative nucleotidyltransferase with HDIG domain